MPSRISYPTGVCMQLLADWIQNAYMSVTAATAMVAEEKTAISQDGR
jgi:hypothetical protein